MPVSGIMVQQTRNKVKVTTHIFMLITLAFTLTLTLTLPPTQRADYGEFHSSKTFTGSPLGLTLLGWAGGGGGPNGGVGGRPFHPLTRRPRPGAPGAGAVQPHTRGRQPQVTLALTLTLT